MACVQGSESWAGERTNYKRAYRPGRRQLRCRSQAALQQRSPPWSMLYSAQSQSQLPCLNAPSKYVGVAENAGPRWRVGAVAFMQKLPGTVCPCRYLCNLQVEAGLHKCAVAGSGAAIPLEGGQRPPGSGLESRRHGRRATPCRERRLLHVMMDTETKSRFLSKSLSLRVWDFLLKAGHVLCTRLATGEEQPPRTA